MQRKMPSHNVKQLKFVLPGLLTTYLFRPLTHLWFLLDGREGGWPRLAAKASLGTGALTILLFGYLLGLPLVRGKSPNYRQWRDSGELSVVIPLLTTSILLGYFLLIGTLSFWTELGPLMSFVAGTGLYILSFGLIGLVPVPNRGST